MKAKLGAKNSLYPLPTTLVGAMVEGRPNYIAIAHVGVMAMNHVSVSMNRSHYTNRGIVESGVFSVNLPSIAMAAEADYCGLMSGRDVDKSQLFQTFYGELSMAPMIAECPVNMECRVERVLDFPRHDVFIGEVVATYCDESCMADGHIDFGLVQPMLFVMSDRSYWRIGKHFAKAWEIGKKLM